MSTKIQVHYDKDTTIRNNQPARVYRSRGTGHPIEVTVPVSELRTVAPEDRDVLTLVIG